MLAKSPLLAKNARNGAPTEATRNPLPIYNPGMKRCVLFLLLTVILAAQAGREVEITSEPHHQAVLANDQVRVFNVEIPPHSETLMHWHRHDYVYVTLGNSQVVNTVKGKAPVNVEMRDGQTGFLRGGFAHMARNLSGQPYRNVTVEFLQDDKVRHAPEHWDPAHPEEDRGLDILNGGTQEILFVKDGVRVSECELQPEGVIPPRSPSHPLLLVAVTDLDLFTNDPRTHGPPEPDPISRHFKSGDSIWLPHGFGRPLVNAGQHLAKFVTLEFR